MLMPAKAIEDKPTHAARRAVPKELELIAHFMDSAMAVPGSRLRFGFDALVGLIPGIGDLVTTMVSIYLISTARRLGVPRVTLVRMASNVAIDFGLGAIPILGDAFDLFWKANERNLHLIRRHATATPSEARRLTIGDWAFVAILFVALVSLVIGAAAIGYFLLTGIYHLLFPVPPQIV